MKLGEIGKYLDARVLVGHELLDMDIHTICGSDLMSDVLAFTKESTLLLTGLCNTQTIRTAEMSDLSAIIFVRGKKPSPEVLSLAQENALPILVTEFPMYESCGKLYALGLAGCARKEDLI